MPLSLFPFSNVHMVHGLYIWYMECTVYTWIVYTTPYLASNFPDHHNALRLWVIGEPLQAVDEVGAVERIAPDTDTGALAHAC